MPYGPSLWTYGFLAKLEAKACELLTLRSLPKTESSSSIKWSALLYPRP